MAGKASRAYAWSAAFAAFGSAGALHCIFRHFKMKSACTRVQLCNLCKLGLHPDCFTSGTTNGETARPDAMMREIEKGRENSSFSSLKNPPGNQTIKTARSHGALKTAH
jgi:hypothetical protein